MQFKTPILFILFNRPDLTNKSFEMIQRVRPKYLYIAADGPRDEHPEDIEKCRQTRKIVEKIDWECEVKTLFRDKNLGCKYGVSSAIDWFFENVEEGIILEDDCLPDPSFFLFCDVLLNKYRNQNKIMHISGVNFQKNEYGDGSYYASKYAHVWGWATWKRAWKYYSLDLSNYALALFDNISFSKSEFVFWENTLSRLKNDDIDTWDMYWLLAIFQQQGVCLTPNVNLVCNIGFINESTHTSYKRSKMANISIHSLKNLVHPTSLGIQKRADSVTYKISINPPPLSTLHLIYHQLLDKFNDLLSYLQITN